MSIARTAPLGPDLAPAGNDDLKAAIKASIRDSRAFREVVADPAATYALTVAVMHVGMPISGLNITVDARLDWTLVRTADNVVVFRRTVQSVHTSAAAEAFAGVERLRLAYEGAMRDNIRRALIAMSDTGS